MTDTGTWRDFISFWRFSEHLESLIGIEIRIARARGVVGLVYETDI